MNPLTWYGELAHHIAVVPLAVLTWLGVWDSRRAAWLWLLGAAFGVSWLADWAAHWTDTWVVAALYPPIQAALVVLALAPLYAWRWVVVIVTAAVVAMVGHGFTGPEFFARAVAWGAIVVLARARPRGLMRASLLVYFGVGLMAWGAYSLLPAWHTWGIYQACRAAGLGLFTAHLLRRPA